MKENIEEGMLYAESMFGFNSRKPIVRISYGITFEVQVSPAEARHFAQSILEAAEGAETDAFMVNFMQTKVGFNEDQQIAAFMADFRKERDAAREEYNEEKNLPPEIQNAVNKSKIICECGHNLLAHLDGDEVDRDCKLIGCECGKFKRRRLV